MVVEGIIVILVSNYFSLFIFFCHKTVVFSDL